MLGAGVVPSIWISVDLTLLIYDEKITRETSTVREIEISLSPALCMMSLARRRRILLEFSAFGNCGLDS